MAYPNNTDDDPVKGDQLKSIVERIERLDEEAKDLNEDRKDIYAEAKSNGYDVRVLRKVIALRRRDPNERAEEEAILDLYLQAVGDRRAQDEPAVARAQKQRVGAKPTAVEKAAAKLAETGVVSMEIPANASPIIQRAAEAMEKAGVPVTRTKPVVGSFAPPAEIPDDDPFNL